MEIKQNKNIVEIIGHCENEIECAKLSAFISSLDYTDYAKLLEIKKGYARLEVYDLDKFYKAKERTTQSTLYFAADNSYLTVIFDSHITSVVANGTFGSVTWSESGQMMETASQTDFIVNLEEGYIIDTCTLVANSDNSQIDNFGENTITFINCSAGLGGTLTITSKLNQTPKEQYESNMNALADSINTKANSSGKKTIVEMKTLVDGIALAKVEEEKTKTITTNGTTIITPSSGKTMSKVTVTTNVPSGGDYTQYMYPLTITPSSITVENIDMGKVMGFVPMLIELWITDPMYGVADFHWGVYLDTILDHLTPLGVRLGFVLNEDDRFIIELYAINETSGAIAHVYHNDIEISVADFISQFAVTEGYICGYAQ